MQIFRDKNGLWNTTEYLLWRFHLEYLGLQWSGYCNKYSLSASSLFIKSVYHSLLVSRSTRGAGDPGVAMVKHWPSLSWWGREGCRVGLHRQRLSIHISAQQGSAFYSYSDLSSKKQAGLNPPHISAVRAEHNDGWPKPGRSMKMRKRQRGQIPANK